MTQNNFNRFDQSIEGGTDTLNYVAGMRNPDNLQNIDPNRPSADWIHSTRKEHQISTNQSLGEIKKITSRNIEKPSKDSTYANGTQEGKIYKNS